MRSLLDNAKAVVDLGVVLLIGIAFIGLMIVGYIIYVLWGRLAPDAPLGNATERWYANFYNMSINVTGGWDDAIALILVAITIFILALAISALLLLRGRQ